MIVIMLVLSQFFVQNSSKAEDDVNKYYFYFAFENSKCKDYISEKVYRALQVIRWINYIKL